jgi:hypothetical protein
VFAWDRNPCVALRCPGAFFCRTCARRLTMNGRRSPHNLRRLPDTSSYHSHPLLIASYATERQALIDYADVTSVSRHRGRQEQMSCRSHRPSGEVPAASARLVPHVSEYADSQQLRADRIIGPISPSKSASPSKYVLKELLVLQSLQKRLQASIRSDISKHQGVLCYMGDS